MKKLYQKPTVEVTSVLASQILCASKEVTNVQSEGTGIGYGGGSNQPACVRRNTADKWETWGE
jgi:hypothetical protein